MARFTRYICDQEYSVSVKESSRSADFAACKHKTPVRISISKNGRTVWKPALPLCLSALVSFSTKRGKEHAADDAAAFFEARHCRYGKVGGKRRRSK